MCDQEFRELHATWLQQRDEEGRNDGEGAGGREGEGGGEAAAEALADVETPVAFPPQDLPAAVHIDIPSPILQAIGPPLIHLSTIKSRPSLPPR